MSGSHEEACLRVAGLFSSRWLRGYVAGKLRGDVVFPAVYELLRESEQPILDIGCGVGLLSFYLRERGLTIPIRGVDIDARKVTQARLAVVGKYAGLEFNEADVSAGLPAFTGSVTVLDLLHYLAPSEQADLLEELAVRVAPGAMLLLRDSPRENSARFWMTYAGELFAQAISWNWKTKLHFATEDSINAAFPPAEFTRESRSASGGMPFNNRLFIYRRHSSAAAPAAAGQTGNHEPRVAEA